MRYVLTFVAWLAALSIVFPVNGFAQTEAGRHNTKATRLKDALSAGSATGRPQGAEGMSVLRQVTADPVGDGIGYGALIGAGAGAALVAVLYAKCDGTCDAPEPAPMYLTAAAVGAGAGALAGWIIDGARRNSDRRVRVSALVTPKRQSVRVALRF